MADLTSALVDFCMVLREDHGFAVGRDTAYDALAALERLGTDNRARMRARLRAIYCTRPEQIEIFDRLFDAYFDSGSVGAPQPKRARQKRPDDRGATPENRDSRFQLGEESAADSWMALRARYSPVEGASAPPAVPVEGYADADALVRRMIERLRLGRARRLRAAARGARLDLRRTVRASLQTGGEILALKRREPPLRNPRFVILIDASRSMIEHAGPALQIAHALCRRTRRASAFAFSTSLREITHELRALRLQEGRSLDGIGEAWGGGTRIGANLKAFARNFRSKLDDHTYVIVVSDGLDVGDLSDLQRATREIARRSAGIAWVNPHAAEPGFTPTAGGMLAVLPYLTSLTAWSGLTDA
jgi:hypothetical protein